MTFTCVECEWLLTEQWNRPLGCPSCGGQVIEGQGKPAVRRAKNDRLRQIIREELSNLVETLRSQ